jgi:hypothetical protein
MEKSPSVRFDSKFGRMSGDMRKRLNHEKFVPHDMILPTFCQMFSQIELRDFQCDGYRRCLYGVYFSALLF